MVGRARLPVVAGTLALAWAASGASSSLVAASQKTGSSERAAAAESKATREASASAQEGKQDARQDGKRRDKESGKQERANAKDDGQRASSAVAEHDSADGASPVAGESGEQEWPQIQSGVWQIEGTLKQANGRSRHWTEKTKQCEDPTVLFQGHRGRAAGRRGCTFQSTKVSSSEFKVIAECMVPKKGLATSESTVTVKSDKEFEMQIHLRTSKKDARTSQTGHWVSACAGSAPVHH